jgi:hypothetical protein
MKSNKVVLHHVVDEDVSQPQVGASLVPPQPLGGSRRRLGSGIDRSSKTHSYSGSVNSRPSVGSSRGSRSSIGSKRSNRRRKAGKERSKQPSEPAHITLSDFKQNPKFKGKLISSYRMPQFFQRTDE